MNKAVKSSVALQAGYLLLLGHLLVWSLGCWLLLSGLDRFADAHELYAWGIVPQWGTFKHPPLLSWLVGGWFRLWPRQDWAFHLLAVLNSTIAIYFIGKLTRELLDFLPDTEYLAFLAMAFFAFSLSYGNLALKLNMNTILLSLWPLTAWCFVRCMKTKSLLAAIVLAIAAAACMLAKYFSAIFLASLFITSLSSRSGRLWYRSLAPYLSLLVFVLLLLPHLYWVVANDFITFKYVQEQSEDVFQYRRIISFSLMIFATSIIGAVVLYFAARPWQRLRLTNDWKITTKVLFFSPIILTIVLAWCLSTEISSPWALPMSFVLPALLLLYWRPLAVQQSAISFIFKALYCYWALALILGAVNSWMLSSKGAEHYYLPRQELALLIEQQQRQPQWVSGDWQYSTALTFYQQDFIHAIPELPGKGGALVHTPQHWQQQKGLLIFHAQQQQQLQQAEAWLRQHDFSLCQQSVQVARQGWRFLQHKPFEYILLWAYPQQQTVSCD